MNRQERIKHHLLTQFSPAFLTVDDESANHHVPEHAETHYKIVVVSAQFSGLNRISRHRLVNKQLAGEFNKGMHALSMHLYSLEEWQTRKAAISQSPSCQDGYENK